MTAAAAAAVASQREVARRLGLSHTALQKAARTGRIAPEPGGGWDVEEVRARLAASSDPTRKSAGAAAVAASPPPTTPPPPPAAASEPLAAPGAASGGGASSFHNARTANEMLKAQERKLRLEERRVRPSPAPTARPVRRTSGR